MGGPIGPPTLSEMTMEIGMERFTLIWTLTVKGQPLPYFGFETDISLDSCYRRIRGIWKGFELSTCEPDRSPIVWGYEIKDMYGRIIDVDQCLNGVWINKEPAEQALPYPD